MVNVLITSRNVMKTSIMTVEITVMKRDVVWFNTYIIIKSTYIKYNNYTSIASLILPE